MAHIRALLLHTLVIIREILRGGSAIGLIVVWFLCLLIGTAFGSVSIGDQVLVIKDFGLFLSSLATILLTVVSGASLLSKDIKQKHIYTILSKPISRFEYVLAKWMGIWGASVIINLMLHALLVLYVYGINQTIDTTLLIDALFLAGETLVISSLCLLVGSIFVTPLLVGIICFFLFVAGRNLESMYALQQNLPKDSSAHALMQIVLAALPHLYYCNVANGLPYHLIPSLQYTIQSGIYCFSYATACFILASIFLSKRNFN